MNQERFDDLTRSLATGKISRGRALKMLGAALVGASFASIPGAAWAAKNCKPLGSKCKTNVQCCSGNCVRKPRGRGSVCGCPTGQTLCPANNSCVQDCPPGQTLDPTTCRCTQCQNASDCPTPNNGCQRATCTNGVCGVENVPDGTSCEDQNSCTTNDVCTAGVCAGTLREGCVRCQADTDCAGVPVDQCHRAVCGAQGFCIVEDLPDGTTCDDGDPCTEGNVCTAGVCAGTQIGDCVRCQNDGDCSGMGVDNPCREAVCTQAGVCAIQDKVDGTPCSDANACTENDVCYAGVCGGCVIVDNSNPDAPPTPCEDPCATQTVSEQAKQDIGYSVLVDYLTKEGFALDAGPYLSVIQENGTPVGKLLSSRFLNPTRPSEAAGLHYRVDAATGGSAAVAVVADEEQQTVLYTLSLFGDGEVHKVTPSEPAPQTSQLSTFSTAGAGGGLLTQTSGTAGAPLPITPMQVSYVGGCCTEQLDACEARANHELVLCFIPCGIACATVETGIGAAACAACVLTCTGLWGEKIEACQRQYGCARYPGAGPGSNSYCRQNVCCFMGETGCGMNGTAGCVEGGGTQPSSGTCCPSGTTCCPTESGAGVCVNTSSDPQNCGSCRHSCITPECGCAAGFACPPGTVACCGGHCVHEPYLGCKAWAGGGPGTPC